jgi:hypothetical protein
MAQELDFTDPEHAAGSTMAAFALAQLSFSTLVKNELIPKADAEKTLKRLIKANEGGGIAHEVAAAPVSASSVSLRRDRRVVLLALPLEVAFL